MERRRFLLLLGATTTGVVLSTGLIELPRKMVLAAGGSCSFCGRGSRETRGMAGVAGRHVRICKECVELCGEILAEESVAAPPRPPPPRKVAPPMPGPAASDEEVRVWLDSAGLEISPERFRELLQKELAINRTTTAFKHVLACSFCDTPQKDVRKLIAGPTVYVCDVCIGDAAAFLHTWRDA